MGQLPGRIAVVTGGGRGIGRALALRFAREGATVVVSSRTASDLDAVLAAVADEGGAPGLAVVADASDRDDARRPVEEAVERFGRVDVLVNNVGGTVGRAHDPFTGDDAIVRGHAHAEPHLCVVDDPRRAPGDARAAVRPHHQHRVGCVQARRRHPRLHHRQARARSASPSSSRRPAARMASP